MFSTFINVANRRNGWNSTQNLDTMMHKFIPFFLILTACTYSINQVHTEGVATDVVDENQAATADVSAQIPLK